jgi:hypothetical protein
MEMSWGKPILTNSEKLKSWRSLKDYLKDLRTKT